MEPLQIQLILEILGRPAENVKQALASIVTKLSNEQQVKILEHTFHEPVPVKDAVNLYTAFADITLEIRSLDAYFNVLFMYLPSHVELLYPEQIILTNAELNAFANSIMQRMHQYDAVVKNALVERDIFLKKVQELAPHVFHEIAKVAPAPSATQHGTPRDSNSATKKKSPRKTASKKASRTPKQKHAPQRTKKKL